MPTTKESLRIAAAPTLQRIHDDAEGKSDRLRVMLEYIAEHLFSPKLNVNRLKQAYGIRDNSVAIHFHAALGSAPHAYYSAARIEVARRLLERTNIPVWEIAELLGYSSIQVASRAFARATGERPTAAASVNVNRLLLIKGKTKRSSRHQTVSTSMHCGRFLREIRRC